MSTLYKTIPTTVITLKTAFLLSNIRKLEAKQACVISWTQSKRNVQMKVPGVKYLCTLLVEFISKRLFSRSWVSVMQMWQQMQVIMRILLTSILISPICCWGGNITQIVNIINISYLNPTHYSHFLFVKQQNLSMSMQVKHNILHLTSHPSDTDHASQLAVGKLFLDALITKILFIDVKLSQCTNSEKGGQHDRSSVIEAIQDLLEGMNYEQIAIAVGRLYAGMTQKLQYGKAVEEIVAQTVKKLSSSAQLNLSKEQSEYSVFQLNSSITSNATFKQNQSFQLDQPNNSPKYVEKQPQFQVSPTKNFLKYVEKDSQFQGSPSKNSPKYIEKTPERVKQQMPFQLDLSQIKQANGSPSINKSTTLFTNNQSPAQEPAKKHVETAKDPDPNWIPLQTVDAYLLKIPVFRSEINLVSQIMKLPPIRYYRFRYESRYYVRAEFKIAGYWTYYKPLEFYGEGWSAIYRQACEQAAYQVLRVLFMYCPELWRKFVELKRRKGLE